MHVNTLKLPGPLYFGDATEALTKKWTFGGGFTGWCMPGTFDEIRISKGALSEADFLRFGPAGVKDTIWRGLAGVGGVVNWNDAASWTMGVPVGNDTAIINPVSVSSGVRTNNVFRMTPPADFAGTISLQNDVKAITAPTDCRFPVHAALTVLDGATWTVEGDGVLIATAGVDAHVSSSNFTGVIDVPAGVSFTIPAELNPAVRFIGSGELVLSNPATFDRCALFSGNIRFNGSSFTVSQFAQAVRGNYSLDDGQTLTIDQRTLALGGVRAMAPLTDSNAWDFAGVTWYVGPEQRPFPTNFPVYVDNDLVLTDSPAQHRIVTYKERKFKLSDIWHVEFTVVPDTSSTWLDDWGIRPSGMVGVFFSQGKQSGVPYQMLPANADDGIYGGYLYFNRLNDAQGFRWKHTWISQPGIGGDGYGWRYGTTKAWYPESGTAADVYPERQMDGIDLRQPIDVSVNCEKGVVCFAFRQNGKSFSVIRDYSAILKVTSIVQGVYQPLKEETGYTLMIAGSTDFCIKDTSQTKPWQKQTIRNFRGWWWNRYESPWKVEGEDGFSAINTTNWKLSTYDGVNGLSDDPETSRCTASGGYQILKRNAKQVTSLHSLNVVSASEPVLVTFDYTMGDCFIDGTKWKYGYALTAGFNAHDADHVDAKMTKWTWQPCQTSVKWENLPSWIMEWNYAANPKVLQYGFIANASKSEWSSKMSVNDYHRRRTTAHISLLYDGEGSFYYRFNRPATVESSNHKSHSPDGDDDWAAEASTFDDEYCQTPTASNFELFKTSHANGMHIDIRSANADAVTDTKGWNECWIENLKVRKLSSAIAKAEIPVVTVAANASATLDGGSAVVGRLNLGEGATLTMNGGTVAKIAAENAALAGTPDFTGPVTIVVPDDWAGNRDVWHTVVDVSAVTSALPDPEEISVVTESGIVPEHPRVMIRDGKLRVVFENVGFRIIIQ